VEVIGECLDAAATGPFFPDWEFQTLFGLDREEVRRIASDWPTVDSDTWVAVANSLGNLLGYPHGLDGEWTEYVSVPRAEVEGILKKWKSLKAPLNP